MVCFHINDALLLFRKCHQLERCKSIVMPYGSYRYRKIDRIRYYLWMLATPNNLREVCLPFL